ncbi:RNA-binding transcriptional accessory protein [Pyxidicoccus fallax]|uniref:RNA-binding transcriptional accessory protein n=1 Tax=Pyxidicoccus fallax TaxID=394095 RepID=A0A848M026_9BACT|nr:Tex family protein [Pyxidicoccus fallax]NMO23456.1 RNA-binding transcriptional accessory protein [Pyxidicoccus fallax]NPC86597.1 RNA-binding transcriptional accessory protein [Pyxidicoccus fallax]
MHAYAAELSQELGLKPEQVDRTLALNAEGATVPFIARYRKEATGGLDEVQIQTILDRAEERAELDSRRDTILRSIEEQGKLTPALEKALKAAKTRTELEDLYLPYKPKRRTRAAIARERGLEPLADLLWKQEGKRGEDANGKVKPFVNPEKEVPDLAAALAGARDICAERVAEDAGLRREAREVCTKRGTVRSDVVPAKKGEPTKFENYYGHEEPLSQAPSHRVLALMRGEEEGVLKVKLGMPDDEVKALLATRVVTKPHSLFAQELRAAVEDGWERLMGPSLESELRAELKERADRQAIGVFGENLRHLLLSPPAGARAVLALDPGLRTGIKLAMMDATSKVVETLTLYTERSADERARAAKLLEAVVKKHKPELIAVGNGTGSREAEGFVKDTLKAMGSQLPVVSVSEQGASVYSASEVARDEFPDLDVSLRGAVSIGRRLQDPLAELVKIDPKSIGVGQYQHDVDQGLLKKKLGEVVDSCVNAVGVDVNTASPQLLEHVSGVGPSLAKKLVAHRATKGRFTTRRELLKVSGLGPKTFEQAAGFLRVRGPEPLDASAVHPERYPVVERMAKDLGVDVGALVGNAALVRKIDPKRYLGPDLGEMTLKDILAELEKPSRDPRGDFTAPQMRDDLRTLEDVKEGMVLQGVVTNVTAFGAFVDVGVHQDGLVHVSQLSTKFVKDPSEVVKVGDRLTVRVLTVDLARKRLALSVRAVQEGGAAQPSGRPAVGGATGPGRMTERGGGGGPRQDSRPSGASSKPSGSGGASGGGRPAPGADKKGPEPFNNPFRNLKR